MRPFTVLAATAAPLGTINLDTDQLLPARFLKYPRSDGYGAFLLHDMRFAPDGAPRPDFVLNQPAHQSAEILVGNSNFGCGSAREGAVYALSDYGFRCVVAPSFGDIFFNNACKNGLLPVRLPVDEVAALRSLAEREPATVLTVDLERQTVTAPGLGELRFAIDPFRKMCLLAGLDDISLTRQYRAEIDAYRERSVREQPWLAPRTAD